MNDDTSDHGSEIRFRSGDETIRGVLYTATPRTAPALVLIPDVHGISPFVVQAKDTRTHDFSGWLDGPKGVTVQAARAGEYYGVVVVKRPPRPVGDAYAVLRLADVARLVLRLRRAEALLVAAPGDYEAHAEATAAEHTDPFPTG